jgi:hypothetical protein
MDECVHRWMLSYGWMFFCIDEFYLWIELNQSIIGWNSSMIER